MKQLKKTLLAVFLLAVVGNVKAQDDNNPWVIGFGANVVDFYTDGDFNSQTKDLLGNKDWNIIPSVSRVSVEKYLDKGFSFQLAGSLNKIETIRAKDDSDFLYYAIDAAVKYDLNNLMGETAWFDPYVYLGGGYASVDSNGEAMANAGVGFNAWLSENVGLNFQTGTKKGFSSKVRAHYQTMAGLVIRFGGKDTDGDGVYDKKDACPDVAGLAEFNGCPDADGDGIKDSDDTCPNVAGLAAMNGCPDADGDGVADKDDMCPNVKGTKANKGCPDTDGDGVVDKNDKCPSEVGSMANEGCPWPDTDGDSILDKDDKCINEIGPASNNGCPMPVITKAAEASLKEYAEAILFNVGKYSFKAGVSSKLDAMVKVMNANPNAKFVVEGHTDSSGSAALNLRVSEKRAIAVRDYFVKKGVSTTRLEAIGFGEGNPTATNKTRAGRAQNRRVLVKVTNKK
ncbi:MAG: OOP family OmpA-OmpF porin [Flavobacteriales bacterium]|jgi:OOP family OmpA-OmpF porin